MASTRIAVTQWSSDARSALEKLITERYSEVRAELGAQSEGLRHDLQDLTETFRRDLQNLTFDFCDLKGHIHRSQGMAGNAISDHISMLHIGRDGNVPWRVRTALEELKADMIAAGSLFPSDRHEIMEALESVSGQHELIANEIKELLRTQPVFDPGKRTGQ